MTKWTRATLATICGGCNRVIALGAPMKLLELGTVQGGRRIKVRCETCDGPAPPDLPLLIVKRDPKDAHGAASAEPFALARFTPDMLPLTFKRNPIEKPIDREPGEEG